MAVNLEAKLMLRSRGFTQKVDEAKGKVGGLSKSFSGLRGVIGTALALGGITKFTSGLTSLADTIDNLNKRMDIGVEKTQLLKIAAEENGQSVEVVADAFKTLIIRSQEALAGNEKIADGFKSLGITMDMLASGDRGAMFDQLNKALTQSPNRIEATAQAMMVLGEPIEKLVPILETFNHQAENVSSPETIKSVDRLGDSFARVGRNFKNMGMSALAWVSDLHSKIAISPINMVENMQRQSKELEIALKGGIEKVDAESMAQVAKRKKEMEEATKAEEERKKKEEEIAKAAAEHDKVMRANALDRMSDEKKLLELRKEQNKLIEEANRLQIQGKDIEMFKKLTAASAMEKNIRGLEKADTPSGLLQGITQSTMQQAGARMAGADQRLTTLNQKQLNTQKQIYAFMQRAVDRFHSGQQSGPYPE